MPEFTIERTFDVPHYRHATYEAPSLADALAMDAANDDWSAQERDYDGSKADRVTGAWASAEAYTGEALSIPDDGPSLAVILEGGMVQAVVSDDPAGVPFDHVTVIDYDTEDGDPRDFSRVKQSDGSHAAAYVRAEMIGRATIGLDDFSVPDDAENDGGANPFHPESPEGRAWDAGDRSSVENEPAA